MYMFICNKYRCFYTIFYVNACFTYRFTKRTK